MPLIKADFVLLLTINIISAWSLRGDMYILPLSNTSLLRGSFQSGIAVVLHEVSYQEVSLDAAGFVEELAGIPEQAKVSSGNFIPLFRSC